MKKVLIVLVICILILMILVGLMIFKLNGENDNPNLFGSSDDVSIDFFSMKTHSGFNDTVKNTKYRITNEEELDMFHTLYNGFNLSKNYDLSKNTIFVQTQTYGSGSVSVDFKGVSIDKAVKFNVSTNSPEIGTMDMAYWYLIAVVPNTKLNDVNINEWKSPVDVNNSLRNEYTITIESNNLDLKNSLNIVEKVVNDIGNIKIQQYHYSPINNRKSYTLISYDKKISAQLVQSINNQGNEMKAEISSTRIKDETDYKSFQDTLNTTGKPYYQINLWSNAINNYKSWRNYNRERRRNSRDATLR